MFFHLSTLLHLKVSILKVNNPRPRLDLHISSAFVLCKCKTKYGKTSIWNFVTFLIYLFRKEWQFLEKGKWDFLQLHVLDLQQGWCISVDTYVSC